MPEPAATTEGRSRVGVERQGATNASMLFAPRIDQDEYLRPSSDVRNCPRRVGLPPSANRGVARSRHRLLPDMGKHRAQRARMWRRMA